MATVPVGTIIAFGLANADFAALQQQGWWVCDGRTVTDPAATILLNQPTPNLMSDPSYRLGKFLVGAGSVGVGHTDGAGTAPIPDMPVKVQTDGWNANQTVNADPRLLIYSGLSWVDGKPITSSGHSTASGARIEVIPPCYTVIYLICVK
jgi:hypothetical protein